MKIVCISDTHNYNDKIVVPGGDVLVHSGDATINGTVEEVKRFADWFGTLPHKHKIFVAGNHDWLFQRDNGLARTLLGSKTIYLQDSAAKIEGVKFYGSPWQPRFYDWAFNLNRGPELAAKWNLIPDDTDVLISHGPPEGILDQVQTAFGFANQGCEELLARVRVLASNGNLRAHIFGHIHFGHGLHEEFGVRFVNASICDEEYLPGNLPVVVDI
jgi:Icc-related predicted phosphoesterase